jgi:hypothetical protein
MKKSYSKEEKVAAGAVLVVGGIVGVFVWPPLVLIGVFGYALWVTLN